MLTWRHVCSGGRLAERLLGTASDVGRRVAGAPCLVVEPRRLRAWRGAGTCRALRRLGRGDHAQNCAGAHRDQHRRGGHPLRGGRGSGGGSVMKPIRTPEDHRRLLDEIAALMGAEADTPEADRLEVLAVLASEYEKRELPAESDPVDLLNVVMRGKGLSQAALSDVLGSRARASEVLSRRRNLSAEMIERLSRAWSIPRRLLAAPFPIARRRPSGTLLSILIGTVALVAAAASPFVIYGRDLPDVAPLVRDANATDLTKLPPHVVQAFIAGQD